MTLVVDASVAVKWFLQEPLWEPARALVTSGQVLVAPDLLPVEVGNVFAKRMRKGELDLIEAQGNVRSLLRGRPEYFDSHDLMAKALELANLLAHSVYDCLYLALAILEGTRVVTADERFHDRVQGSELAGYTRLLTHGPSIYETGRT